MDKDLYNISKVECFVDSLLKNKVSKNVYPTKFPSVLPKSVSDVVVYDISVNDYDGVGQGIINVFLYAKPISSSGEKNVKKLSAMESSLNMAIKNNNDKHYILSRFRNYSDYDSNRNLYVNIVSLILQIV